MPSIEAFTSSFQMPFEGSSKLAESCVVTMLTMALSGEAVGLNWPFVSYFHAARLCLFTAAVAGLLPRKTRDYIYRLVAPSNFDIAFLHQP